MAGSRSPVTRTWHLSPFVLALPSSVLVSFSGSLSPLSFSSGSSKQTLIAPKSLNLRPGAGPHCPGVGLWLGAESAPLSSRTKDRVGAWLPPGKSGCCGQKQLELTGTGHRGHPWLLRASAEHSGSRQSGIQVLAPSLCVICVGLGLSARARAWAAPVTLACCKACSDDRLPWNKPPQPWHKTTTVS